MGLEVGKYRFSSDFLKMSEEDFKKEMKSRFNTKVRDAKEIYKKLHGNGSGLAEEDSSISEKENAGEDGVSGAEEAEEVSNRAGEGEAG